MQLARLHARSADFRGLRLRFVSFRFRGSRRSRLRLIWLPRIGVPRSLPSEALFKAPVSLIGASGCCGDSRLCLSLRRRALAASN